MNKTIIALSALLAVQAGVAVDLNLRDSGLAGEQAKVALLSFPAGDVSRLAITDGDGKSVTLAKKDKGWVLPDHKDFPADGDKVKGVLDDLASAQEGAPVAVSAGAAERFKVAKDAFQRKVVFGPAEKPLATVYLGLSQGTRQVDVRRDDQKGVRRIDFGIYKLQTSADNWVDNGVLKTDASKVSGLAWGKVSLERKEAPKDADAAAKDSAAAATADKAAGKTDAKTPATTLTWILDGDTSKPAALDAVNRVVGLLANVSITGLADAAPKADEPPAVDLKITLDGGKSRELKIWAQKDKDYVVEASDVAVPVKLSKSTGSGLIAALADPAFQPEKPAAPVAPSSAAPAAASPGTAPAASDQQSSAAPATGGATSAPAVQTSVAEPATAPATAAPAPQQTAAAPAPQPANGAAAPAGTTGG